MGLQGDRLVAGRRGGAQHDLEAAAAARALAARDDAAPLAPHQPAHDEQAEAEPLDAALHVEAGAVEGLEDAAQVLARDADAAVLDGDAQPAVGLGAGHDAHAHLAGGVLDRVVEQVAEDQRQLVGLRERERRLRHLEPDRLGRKPLALAHVAHAGGEQRADVDRLAPRLARTGGGAGRGQHLVGGGIEPLEVGAHAPAQPPEPRRPGIAHRQRLDAEPQRGEGRLHLAGHGVAEGLLALALAHLAHQPRAQQRQPRDQQREEQPARHEQRPVQRREPLGHGAEIAHDDHVPRHRQREREQDEDDADREGQPDRAAHGGAPRTGIPARTAGNRDGRRRSLGPVR